MFKKIAIAAFSFVSVSLCNQDISKLRVNLLAKEQALAMLSKEINKQEKLIVGMWKSIKKIRNRYLNKEEQKRMDEEIETFVNRFHACPIEEIKTFIMTDFFSDKSEWGILAERIKSLTIRILAEQDLLQDLISRYADQWQEVEKLKRNIH
jgi:hypothetical protein